MLSYSGPLLVVKDMARARAFYQDVMGLEVVHAFGANVAFNGGLSLQTLESWTGFIGQKEDTIVFRNQATELYFEADDLDAFILELEQRGDIAYVHPPVEHRWGQRGVRIYDRDGHIIEISETLNVVAKRFTMDGMSPEEVAVRMDIALDYALELLKN